MEHGDVGNIRDGVNKMKTGWCVERTMREKTIVGRRSRNRSNQQLFKERKLMTEQEELV